ncbi:MAG TPA: helix-turn-helix transcriptional regulator [Solirubrobacteraceae bacterium]|jgi:transcriptional regulator with XRE-family HTH domain|nr:helix-turn-helix transcriptional regulator [Solirubrobacteraceae bacterium]
MHTVQTRRNNTDRRLAEEIRRTREGRGETQEDVARRAGLTVAAYARIERGTSNPRWTTVLSIAEALDVNLSLAT